MDSKSEDDPGAFAMLDGICTALNLSDDKKCLDAATSANGLFCRFHSKQAQGLYRGYKLRNARYDALVKSPPQYLATTAIPLANQTFADVSSETVLDEMYQHLYLRHALLERVIRARKIHHSHFFSFVLDYGHQHYLDNLQSQKFTLLRALERFERRTADVLYKQKKWFNWVRARQDEEEVQREKESKRVKQEAALFKRQCKRMELRMRKLREREEVRRQEEYLDEAYRNRQAQIDSDESDWDPIEEVVETREEDIPEDMDQVSGPNAPTETPMKSNGPSNGQMVSSNTKSLVSTNGRPNGKNKKKAKNPTPQQVETSNVETKSEMRQRLRHGSRYTHDYRGAVLSASGRIEPFMQSVKIAALPDEEVDQLIEEIGQIKYLHFCRLLLSNAALLPAALRSKSIDDFLNDEEISVTDLRDLCLKIEQPRLQEIRDAYADLMRSGEESDDDENDGIDAADQAPGGNMIHKSLRWRPPRDTIPGSWLSKREKKIQKQRKKGRDVRDTMMDGAGLVDFGVLDEGDFKAKKIRVSICGKSIYNYPKEKSMTRGGWLHFSIIAKDSNLYDSIHLCKNWDEFFELNILAIFKYFPAAGWLDWVANPANRQLLQLGLIPFFQFEGAMEATDHQQSGSRGGGRRVHNSIEARNYICANIQRDSAVSRRFIQYLAMQINNLCLLVRDAKTSRIIVTPPREQLWLIRGKAGTGRASKNTWTVLEEVGPPFFEKMDRYRKWHFGFTDYYDIYVWDLEAGKPFPHLYNVVQEVFIKAHRFRTVSDFYNPAAPILKTLTNDSANSRVRELKSGEAANSIYDDIHHEGTKFLYVELGGQGHDETPQDGFYNEADALEDQILFPDESRDEPSVSSLQTATAACHLAKPALATLEQDGWNMERWINGIDRDEDSDDIESDSRHGSAEDDEIEDGVGDSNPTSSHGGDPNDLSDDAFTVPSDQTRKISQLIKKWMPNRDTELGDMQEEWDIWLDKERAKGSMHRADLEPGAQKMYIEQMTMTKKMDKYTKGDTMANIYFDLLNWLDIGPESHRHVFRDLRTACIMISLFCSTTFFDSESGKEFKDTLLINQVEWAQKLPNRRRDAGNRCLPKELWNGWDNLNKGTEGYPLEWNIVLRPILAHPHFFAITVFKAGIILNGYHPFSQGAAGHVIAAREPGRDLDFYIDYRHCGSSTEIPRELQDPRIPTETLRVRNREFSKGNPNARFAVLKLWSAPHFYPLMLGLENRENLCFQDGVERCWEWKFVPKDMWNSEWSMHHASRMRLAPYKRQFKDRVIVKRNLFLVMGTDEDDLFKLAAGVTFAIQTRPFRLEVDLWKSFANIDIAFLEALNDKWLD